jgi:hypothetical protein
MTATTTTTTMASSGLREHLPGGGKATNMLHWLVCLVPYPPSGMVAAFAIDFITFYFIVENRVLIN